MTSGKKLFFSDKESKALGLKVARSKGLLDPADMRGAVNSIFEEKYDLCRIQMDGSNPEIFKELNDTGFPYSLFAINYRNKIKVPPAQSLALGVAVVECTPDDSGLIRTMVAEILDSKGWIEYHSDWYSCMVSRDRHRELALDYFSSFHREGISGGHTWLLKYKNQNAGVFMGTATGDIFGGTFYGILPAFRSAGLAGQIYIAMLNICGDMGCHYFENDVSIFNIPSMKATVSSKVLPEKIFFNITLFPLLGILTEKEEDKGITGLTASAYILGQAAKQNKRLTYFSSAINEHPRQRAANLQIVRHQMSFDNNLFEIAGAMAGDTMYDTAYAILQ
jgi:hypothetical protein